MRPLAVSACSPVPLLHWPREWGRRFFGPGAEVFLKAPKMPFSAFGPCGQGRPRWLRGNVKVRGRGRTRSEIPRAFFRGFQLTSGGFRRGAWALFAPQKQPSGASLPLCRLPHRERCLARLHEPHVCSQPLDALHFPEGSRCPPDRGIHCRPPCCLCLLVQAAALPGPSGPLEQKNMPAPSRRS